ncbi:histone-lysine N-methyltransferase SUV39H2 [Patella vulgata]|uniref:histone-lysine N-methyltransferase SUV39H2 n=1 Tax=Patella vulgata TaxID=6465 RepID=UPI0021805880|nr:histone-lysine N-methyltransferase SUV39H2 [Patella vulgata]
METNPVNIQCLSGIIDLQKKCEKENLRFSRETNRYLLYEILQKLKPEGAQKLISKLVDKGDIKWSDDEEEYEVEYIADHVEDEGTTFYLIKWKGWSHAHNSWEPVQNIDCKNLIQSYHRELKKKLTKRKIETSDEDQRAFKQRTVDKIFDKLMSTATTENITPIDLIALTSPKINKSLSLFGLSKPTRIGRTKFHSVKNLNPRSKRYKLKKEAIAKELKEWEKKLNHISIDPAKIFVENNVDLEGPPQNFEFITDYREGEGISIPQDPIIGCDCDNCFDNKKHCCPMGCGAQFAYYKNKRVRVEKGTPIYECNKRCRCGPECSNRVVQNGCKFRLSIFRTANGRGWGVKTLDKIKKGCFVIEYVGEVITAEEAERRGRVYDAEGMTYLFDLDYNEGDCPFTVDAGFYGNVSHFINHSCEPNLEVFAVWINTLDPRLPRICLFAKQDIQKGEELTFDYMMTGDTTQKSILSASFEVEQKISQENKQMDESDSGIGSLMEGENNLTDKLNPNTLLNFNIDSESGAKTPKVGEELWSGYNMANTQESSFTIAVPTPPSSDKKRKSRLLSGPKNRIVCQCGAANCRKYLF